MSRRPANSRSVTNTVRELVDLAWTVNDRFHHEQRRGDADSVRVLGGVKVVNLALAFTLTPDWFRVGPPDDFTCDTYLSVEFLDDGRRFHVPRRRWAEINTPAGLTRWINP